MRVCTRIGLPVHLEWKPTAWSLRMNRTPAGSVEPKPEVPRRQAFDDLDALIEVAAEARQGLRLYQSALEKNRRRITQRSRASDLPSTFDIGAVRSTITDRLERLERTQHLPPLPLATTSPEDTTWGCRKRVRGVKKPRSRRTARLKRVSAAGPQDAAR